MGRRANHERNVRLVANILRLRDEGMTVNAAIERTAAELGSSPKQLMKLWSRFQRWRWGPSKEMVEALRAWAPPGSGYATPPPAELIPPELLDPDE